MAIYRCGWSRSTTPMWISAMCVPEPSSRCRKWRPSIGSKAAILQVPAENGVRIRRGGKTHRGSVYRAHIEFELAARRHAPQGCHVKVELGDLAPRSGLLVGVAPAIRRLHARQVDHAVVENQRGGRGLSNVDERAVVSGCD